MSMYDRWKKYPMMSGSGKIVHLKKHTNARLIKLSIELFEGSVIKNHKGKVLYDGRIKNIRR